MWGWFLPFTIAVVHTIDSSQYTISFQTAGDKAGIREVEELTVPEIIARCSNGVQSKCIDWPQVSARDDVRQRP